MLLIATASRSVSKRASPKEHPRKYRSTSKEASYNERTSFWKTNSRRQPLSRRIASDTRKFIEQVNSGDQQRPSETSRDRNSLNSEICAISLRDRILWNPSAMRFFSPVYSLFDYSLADSPSQLNNPRQTIVPILSYNRAAPSDQGQVAKRKCFSQDYLASINFNRDSQWKRRLLDVLDVWTKGCYLLGRKFSIRTSKNVSTDRPLTFFFWKRYSMRHQIGITKERDLHGIRSASGQISLWLVKNTVVLFQTKNAVWSKKLFYKLSYKLLVLF